LMNGHEHQTGFNHQGDHGLAISALRYLPELAFEKLDGNMVSLLRRKRSPIQAGCEARRAQSDWLRLLSSIVRMIPPNSDVRSVREAGTGPGQSIQFPVLLPSVHRRLKISTDNCRSPPWSAVIKRLKLCNF
jgi:hypothetical protein